MSGAAPAPSAAFTQARQLAFLFIRSSEFRDIASEAMKVLQQLIQVRGNIVGTRLSSFSLSLAILNCRNCDPRSVHSLYHAGEQESKQEEVVVETVTTTVRTEYDQYGRPFQTQSTQRNAEVMPRAAAAGLGNVVYEGVQPLPAQAQPQVPSAQFGGACATFYIDIILTFLRT